ncbi:MAG: NAD(P)H-dependent oxidoreductase subunit E [Verrucomicrobia bacterium]|jgi:NADH-quinone oxidoreductase subunit E|nr:NAD(P)H-dependent oxidoreductase subunit E [Verrucomicrobiota bacterium]
MKTAPPFATGEHPSRPADFAKQDEAALLSLLDEVERRHGFVPRDISEELTRLVEIKLERLRRIQGKLDTTLRRDVQKHVAQWRDEEGNLIMILHAIQNQHGYVPREVAMELSRELGVKLARIYEVITFYHYFKLQPPAQHDVTVCNGTACYLKGAGDLIGELRNRLGVAEGQTTPDRHCHLGVVRCIGCCGMAPALVVDGKTYGRVKPSDIGGILDTLKKPEAKR